MSLFLATFFLVYGGMHLYAFRKAGAALRLSLPVRIGLGLFMAVMVAAPVLVRLLETGGFGRPARWLSLGGYSWLGLLFLFVSAGLLVDFLRLSLLLSRRLAGRPRWRPTPRLQLFLPLVAAAAIFAYGSFEARDIRAEHLEIATAKKL
ncbi:MAG: hypothetical protein M0017_13870, partial [Desulfobacteraceae bacterium]|nr:hypothetical protein [Desulfobacteraceae bacterium]